MGRIRRAQGVIGAVIAIAAGIGLAATTSWAAPGAAMTVEPGTDLVDGTSVTITATGLDPEAFVNVAQCISALSDIYEDCDTNDSAYGEADSDGRVTVTLKVDAILTTGSGDTLKETDCRPSGACMIGLMGGDDILISPISFDPDAPVAPPPTLTVTPDEDLTDYQVVSVAASGLVWTNEAVILQCAVANPLTTSDCSTDSTGWVDVSLTDSFTEDVAVSTLIVTEGQGVVDCRTPGSCVLAVAPGWDLTSPAKSASAPLAFDPAGVVVPPTLSVDPSTDLVDGQTVTATGSGYQPGGWVELQVCTSEPSWDSCQWTEGFGEVDATGSFTADVELTALVGASGGDVDCRTAPEPCLLVAIPGGSPDSPRAGRAVLAFDPDAPLLPGPAITVDPSTNLPDETAVEVTGSNFEPDGYAYLYVCQAGDLDACDEQSYAEATPDGAGTFSVGVEVAATFEDWSGQEVDCRAAPGCVVVAYDAYRDRRTTSPLSFAPPGDEGRRYFDAVFDDVDVTHDVVYRDTVDAHGNPVQLTLDVYQPAGDTAELRPAVVWMDGGWFSADDEETPSDLSGYADAFARRGYVAVTMAYRQRPDLRCCPTTDAPGITEALRDGHEDAVAGLEWLHEHAADYRIDHDAIAAGGASAGAANSFGLAYAPGESGGGGGHDHMAVAAASTDPGMDDEHGHDMPEPGSPLIAAALPISGVSVGTPEPGAPPVLAFHGSEDLTAPRHLSEWTCADAEAVGDRCDVVAYDGASGDIASSRQRDIVRRSTAFLAEVVLEPQGYLEPPEVPTTTTTTAPATTTTVGSTPTTTAPPATTGRSGTLPRTGSNDILPLLRLGVALVLVGGGLLHLARQRRLGLAGARVGATSLVAVVGVLLAALVVPHGASAQEAPDATTTTEPTPPTSGDTTTTTVGDEPTTTTTTTGDATTTTTTTVTAADPTSTTTTTTMPGHGGHGDEFPEDWTPEQVAYAQALIDDTEMALPRFANPAILPLLGYTWILDGTQADGFQHWVNLGWFGGSHILDPELPESLVFRNGHEGRVLEAAMFILPWGYDQTNIPADIAWLPGWHTHDNLCFDSQGRLTGLAHDGICDVGFLVIPPPMLHVWIVDTPCGRFAGVDENGLMCDPEHEH